MKFTVITLFPGLIEAFAKQGLVAQACERGLLAVETVNPRQFTSDVHQTVDDRVFGGGDGMAMKVEPLVSAVQSLEPGTRVVVLSPQGRTWTQADAFKMAQRQEPIALVCGRYAGIDHRFTVQYAHEEISLGDFVLNGGELAAMAIVESVIRLKPGVLGNKASALKDSFVENLLECPQFTRPREIAGLPVPEPLLSGHHLKIAEFERAVSLVRTAWLRPDLLDTKISLKKEIELLERLSDLELKSLGLEALDLKSFMQEWK